MNDVLTEVRFWRQVLADSKQTVICSPEMESRCKGYVAARGLQGLISVEASRACPDDRIYVTQTAMDQWINVAIRGPIRPAPVADPSGNEGGQG